MIISKYEKSYDTADGSEQFDTAPSPLVVNNPHVAQSGSQDESITCAADASVDSHESDSSPPLEQPPISPLELSEKPTWSVRSLRDLNQAIRLQDWPENPVHLRRHVADAERKKHQAAEHKARQVASRARDYRNRNRNPWENT